MIAERKECLDKATLVDLLDGRLPKDRFSEAIEHVENCEQCKRASEVHTDATELPWLVRSRGELNQGFENESECQAVVGNLLFHQLRETVAKAAMVAGTVKPPCDTLGPYHLIRALGAGGMGTVYLAEHQRLNRQVAIKLLPRDKLARAGWLDRFNREMKAIAALEHPNVVRALDAGDVDEWHYLVMEYLDGLDVGRVARRSPDIPVRAACEIIRQASLGLGAIHDAGMIHRDIKPSNIFLTRNGAVKLLDLGLVLDGESPLTADERLTTVGHLMGTLPFMAREQLNDARNVDERTDVYSLGATLYRLLAGRPPYGATDNLARIIQAISTNEAPSITSCRSDLPAELSRIVDRMIHSDVAKRPQSATEVAELLKPYCDPLGPKELIRAAIQCEIENEEAGANPSLLLVTSSPLPPKSRWPWLIAAAMFPFAFVLGVIVTITTDRGKIVVETDAANAHIQVTQNTTIADKPDLNLKTFKGKALSEWMEILMREQSPESLVESMDAISSLAETGDEKRSAARQFLVVSRKLGTYPNPTSSSSSKSNETTPSSSFMRGLTSSFQRLSSDGGFEEILSDIFEELEMGTRQSKLACIRLIENFVPYDTFSSTKSRSSKVTLFNLLKHTTDGQSRLQKWDSLLSKNIDSRQEIEKSAEAQESAIRTRLVIRKSLGLELGTDVQLKEWANRKLHEASQELSLQKANLDTLAAESIFRILQGTDFEIAPILIGLLRLPETTNENDVLAAVSSICEAKPVEAAIAFEKGLTSSLFSSAPPKRFHLAITTFEKHHPRPLDAVIALANAGQIRKTEFETECVYSVSWLLARLVLETDFDKDPVVDSKLNYATFGFSRFKIPEEHAQKVMSILYQRLRVMESTSGQYTEPRDTGIRGWASVASKYDGSWSKANFYRYLPKCLELNGEFAILAMADELRNGNDRSTELCLDAVFSLADTLNGLTSIERKAFTDIETAELLLDSVARSDAGKTAIAELETAIDVALERIVSNWDPRRPERVSQQLQRYLILRVVIARFLDHDLAANQAFNNAAQAVSNNQMERIHTTTEQFIAELNGYESVSLPVISELAKKCRGNELNVAFFIDRVYQAKPSEFKDYFVLYLENIAEGKPGYAINIQFDNVRFLTEPSKQANSVWHAIVGKLLADPSSRSKTKQAIQEIIGQVERSVTPKESPAYFKALRSLLETKS